MVRQAAWLDSAPDSAFKSVKALVLDAEGCLTDGLKLVADDGTVWLRFSAIDGLGVWLLTKCGLKVAVVSASQEGSISARARSMGATVCALGVTDKGSYVQNLCEQWNVGARDLCVVGDDFWDIAAIRLAGVSVCPFDARREVVAEATYRTRASGGRGAVREIADRLMAARGMSVEDILMLLEERPGEQ